MDNSQFLNSLKTRFRGFLPVVVDVETGGLNPKKDALLELAAIILDMDENGDLYPAQTVHAHVQPFLGANLDPSSLEFTGIKPFHPFRFAVPEKEILETLYNEVNSFLNKTRCSRAVLVGHNPFFDLGFLLAASDRQKIVNIPFHKFTTFDTATLGGLVFGQTVLARALAAAEIPFNTDEAHSALYDAEHTAKLFCSIVNLWRKKLVNP